MPVPTKWCREGIRAGYVMPDGKIRLAFISNVLDENGLADMHVFCMPADPQFSSVSQDGPIRIATSVRYSGNDPQPGTWHYLHGRPEADLGIAQGINQLPPEIQAQTPLRQQSSPPLANVCRQIAYGCEEPNGALTSDGLEYDVLFHFNTTPPRQNAHFQPTAIMWFPGNVSASSLHMIVSALEAFISAKKNVLIQGRTHLIPFIVDVAYHMLVGGWSATDVAIDTLQETRRAQISSEELQTAMTVFNELRPSAPQPVPIQPIVNAPGAPFMPRALHSQAAPMPRGNFKPRPFGS